METPIPSTGTWFRNRSTSTGGPLQNCMPRYALLATFLVGAGTGVSVDDLAWLRYHQDNKALSRSLQDYKPARTPADDIERIRKVFSPAISDLARTFGVSRQTIYNWLKGDQANPEHIDRLRELALAADMFAEAAIPVNGALLKRKIVEDKSLFEVVHAGGSAKNAAQLLIHIVQRETSQREILAVRFAGRTTTIRSADSDLMAENDVV